MLGKGLVLGGGDGGGLVAQRGCVEWHWCPLLLLPGRQLSTVAQGSTILQRNPWQGMVQRCAVWHCVMRARSQVVYEIPSPGPVARLEILRYHSRNKQLADESALKRVAEITQVWAAAVP
jgi:hypothetical protein